MKRETILVVDDNDDHRNAIQYLLKKQGYPVIPASDGTIGLKELEEHDDIRVLIVDLAMLDISGVDLLERVKNRRHPLRRIVLTAYDDELPFEKAEELKVFSYLTKPISKHSLLFTVKAAFNDLYLEEVKKWEELGQTAVDFVKLLGEKVGIIPGSIRSLTEELGVIPDNIQSKFQQIDDIVERIIKLKGALLGSFEKTELEKVNVTEIIDLSIDLIPIPDDIIVIKKYFPGELLVESNSIDLQKVIEAIILNALDAMQESEKKELTFSTSKKDNDTVQIAIKDTGCGIPEENKDKIFRPFYTTKNGDYFGVGLFCAKNSLAKFGGAIMFQSSKEEGTSFLIHLPLSQSRGGWS
ncbi:MAG: response regulator [Candidatus Aminicenantes bacterium]|nr:response regulator [Candidatus Aminicenantes bacterium]